MQHLCWIPYPISYLFSLFLLIRQCFHWLMNILFPSFPSFLRVWLTVTWAQVPTVTQHCRHKVTPVKFCLNQDLFPQSLSSLLLCLVRMIQSMSHMCILKRFCAVQPNRTVSSACKSSSNSVVCNICDIALGVASPVSRCCRFTTSRVLLQRCSSSRQSLEIFKMKPGAFSLGPEVGNHKLKPACKVSSSSLLCVWQRQW